MGNTYADHDRLYDGRSDFDDGIVMAPMLDADTTETGRLDREQSQQESAALMAMLGARR